MRNTVKYNTLGIVVSDSPAYSPKTTGLNQLSRIQSADFNIDIQRENIKSFNSCDFLDRKIVKAPEVSFSCSYLLTDGRNEKLLGLNIAHKGGAMPFATCLSGLSGDINAFVGVAQDHSSFNFITGGGSLQGIDFIGFGNCFLTDYSINAQVGAFATANASFAASNVRYSCYGDHTYNTEAMGIPNPSVNRTGSGEYLNVSGFNYTGDGYSPAMGAITPGGITLELENLRMIGGPSLSGNSDCNNIPISLNAQSVSISLPVDRVDLKGLGSAHIYNRRIKFPIMGSLNTSILANEFNTGILNDILCSEIDQAITLNIDNSQCLPNKCIPQKTGAMKFKINNARLDSYSLSTDIGGNALADLTYSFSDGSRYKGLFMSGNYAQVPT